MMSLLIMALWRSMLGNSYELPSMITAVIVVKCLDTAVAQVFIMNRYFVCTSWRNLVYASILGIKGLNLTEILYDSSIWWGLISLGAWAPFIFFSWLLLVVVISKLESALELLCRALVFLTTVLYSFQSISSFLAIFLICNDILPMQWMIFSRNI